MGDPSQIKLSIALVTRNRPDSLNLALESLRAQSYQPYEVIVSDDSDPEYQSEIKKLASTWQCQYIKGPRRGLYANRNSAALACTGTHIRTMDDDHRFPSEHFQTCISAVDSDPQAIWTVGEACFVNGEYYLTLPTANQLHPSGVGQSPEDPDDNWAIADGSTIYPAKVFNSGHRMVEWYGYGPSYLEFGAYLYSRGFKSRCIKNALVQHYAGPETVTRAITLEAIESQLYSSLCFNLYFRPNNYLVLKYTVARIVQARFDHRLFQALPLVVSRARHRWNQSS